MRLLSKLLNLQPLLLRMMPLYMMLCWQPIKLSSIDEETG